MAGPVEMDTLETGFTPGNGGNGNTGGAGSASTSISTSGSGSAAAAAGSGAGGAGGGGSNNSGGGGGGGSGGAATATQIGPCRNSNQFQQEHVQLTSDKAALAETVDYARVSQALTRLITFHFFDFFN